MFYTLPYIKKLMENSIETKDIFYLLQDIIENRLDNFYEKDYIFGESVEIEGVFEKLKSICPTLLQGGKFIRTSKAKYVRYLNGKEELYKIDGGEEKIENHEILAHMRMLPQIKEKRIRHKFMRGFLK